MRKKGSEFEIQEADKIGVKKRIVSLVAKSWRRQVVQARPNQWGDRFIITKSSTARPEADIVRQKPLRDTDIPLSANSLAVAVYVFNDGDGF